MTHIFAILEMGGRAVYIWSAWAIFAVTIILTIVYIVRQRQRIIRQNAQRYERIAHTKHRQTQHTHLEQHDAGSSAP